MASKTPETPTVIANDVNPMLGRLEGPAPAMQVGFDMVKRGAAVAPLLVGLGAILDGTAGAASVAYGLAIVLVNFALSAALIGWASKISFAAVAGVSLFGFLIRLGLVFVAVYPVAEASWVNLLILCTTLIVAHLGLLMWELRYVSASLAYPGLKPADGNSLRGASAASNSPESKETVQS